jgi:hypothetical protein
MRKSLIIAALGAIVAGTPALHAQHPMPHSDSTSRPMAMMMQHHSVAAIDLLVAHRDSLKLTEDQLNTLAQLRDRYGSLSGHAMHGMAMHPAGRMEHASMHPDRPMDHAMAMHQARRWMTFDRVPGKSVPQVRRARPSHDPMCPMASLTPAQRRQAHQLLDHGVHGVHN